MFDAHAPEHEPFETPRWLLGFYILIVAFGMFSLSTTPVEVNNDWHRKPEPTMWERAQQEAKDGNRTNSPTISAYGVPGGYEQPRPVYSEWSRDRRERWNYGG